MIHGQMSSAAERSRNASASSPPMAGSYQTCGEWVKIWPQVPPYSSCSSTAWWAPPAMEVWAPISSVPALGWAGR